MLDQKIEKIPKRLCVLHSCDNKLCNNPAHLRLGTRAENSADAVKRNRLAKGDRSGSRTHPESRPRGENHPHAKVTAEIVVEIFRLRHEGVTEKQLGETFGVTDVSAILNRKAWGHVTIPAEYQIDAITAKKIHRKNNGAAHRRFSDADIRLARKLYRDGISVAHISQRLGKSYSQTRKIVRREAHADVFDLVTEQRTAPRLNVLRGYTGNEPFSRTFSAPVTSGVTILSGQLISLSPSGTWVLGVLAGKEPFIAFADSVDTDVQSSGLLLGLSCAGQFEIETPWFDNSVAYVESSFLVAATGGSSVSNTSPGTAALGAITLGVASANADVIGYATNGGRLDATAINSQSAPYSLNVTPGNNATAANVIYLLRFRTQWFPHAEYSS